jgi:hypothetical protein
MKLLPFDVCYIIWEMCGQRACILNKDLHAHLENIRLGFISSPLILKYRLVKLMGIQNRNGYKKRPTIRVDNEIKTILLNGSFPLGKITSDGIDPSVKIWDKIIPCSYITMLNRCTSDQYKIVYWEIFEIYCENMDRCKIYKNLFN